MRYCINFMYDLKKIFEFEGHFRSVPNTNRLAADIRVLPQLQGQRETLFTVVLCSLLLFFLLHFLVYASPSGHACLAFV